MSKAPCVGRKRPGELVPTVNYQQQWVNELCFKRIGLGLSPNSVYAGVPSAFTRRRASTGAPSAVIIMTYASFARLGSGAGPGSFDRNEVERFLQGAGVRHIVLGEVHEAAEDLASATTNAVRVFVEWLRDGSVSSVVGFSGTAAPFRTRFEELGLNLAYVVPPPTLVAHGYVAAFAEFGAPFSYSEREWQISDLIQRYKAGLQQYLLRLGGAKLRTAFAAIPIDQRVDLAATMRMYGGRQVAFERIRRRLRAWKTGGELTFLELPFVAVLQLAQR